MPPPAQRTEAAASRPDPANATASSAGAASVAGKSGRKTRARRTTLIAGLIVCVVLLP